MLIKLLSYFDKCLNWQVVLQPLNFSLILISSPVLPRSFYPHCCNIWQDSGYLLAWIFESLSKTSTCAHLPVMHLTRLPDSVPVLWLGRYFEIISSMDILGINHASFYIDRSHHFVFPQFVRWKIKNWQVKFTHQTTHPISFSSKSMPTP